MSFFSQFTASVLTQTPFVCLLSVIEGPEAFFLGSGDHHEAKYDDMVVLVDLFSSSHPDLAATPGHCMYQLVSCTPKSYWVVLSSLFSPLNCLRRDTPCRVYTRPLRLNRATALALPWYLPL